MQGIFSHTVPGGRPHPFLPGSLMSSGSLVWFPRCPSLAHSTASSQRDLLKTRMGSHSSPDSSLFPPETEAGPLAGRSCPPMVGELSLLMGVQQSMQIWLHTASPGWLPALHHPHQRCLPRSAFFSMLSCFDHISQPLDLSSSFNHSLACS